MTRVNGNHVALTHLGEHRDGIPVLFLHGWGLSPRSYRRPLDLLAETHPVIAPALPGFGSSDPLRARSQGVRGVTEHIAGLLDILDVGEPVHVVGHSFGGGVSLHLAAERPDLVRSVTAICPVGGAGTGLVGPHRMIAGLVADGFHTWTPRALGDLVPNAVRHPISVLASAVGAWSADLIPSLAKIASHEIPTLISFADADSVVSQGGIPHVVLPHVEVEVVDGRHSWLLTEPERFAAKVLDRTATHAATLNGMIRAA